MAGNGKHGKLKFYDLKGKKKFTSSNYRIVTKKNRGRNVNFAVAQAPSGIESWRIVSNTKKNNKKKN